MLANKLVFLDIDGVLNSRRSTYAYASTHTLDPVAVALLNELLTVTGSSVVISSTWRLGRTVEQLSDLLYAQGVRGTIIGKTPHHEGFRGQDVARWLELNKWPVSDPEYKYVIFDDGRDFHAGQPLVHVDNKHGLNHLHIQRAIHMLGLLPEHQDFPLLSIQEILNE